MKLFRNYRFILAECSFGQKKRGVNLGPSLLFNKLQKDSEYKLKNITIKNEDFNENFEGYEKLYKITNLSLYNDEIPIILGGDHSISLGSVPAVLDKYKEDLSIVWIDAHADINTQKTSPSGNLHGMPLASVFNLMNPVVKSNYIPFFNQLIYIGLRSIDEKEYEILEKNNITYFTDKDIKKDGIINIMDKVNQKIKSKNIHISFDIDSMDASIVPSTGTPVENGLSYDQTCEVIKSLKNNNSIKGVDFVEYNPSIGSIEDNNLTFNNSINILNKILN